MDDLAVRLAHAQLKRMRGMVGYYHRRFFADTRFVLLVGLALVVAAAAVDERLIALVAPVALLGAAQTAFDASYLTFARQYARTLEDWLNGQAGVEVLVAARMEDTYLYPLDRRKVVTIPAGAPTWFSLMTALYTVLGIAAFAGGVVASIAVLDEAWLPWYLGVLGLLTLAVLGVGLWWFVGGVGERRLAEVLADVGSRRE